MADHLTTFIKATHLFYDEDLHLSVLSLERTLHWALSIISLSSGLFLLFLSLFTDCDRRYCNRRSNSSTLLFVELQKTIGRPKCIWAVRVPMRCWPVDLSVNSLKFDHERIVNTRQWSANLVAKHMQNTLARWIPGGTRTPWGAPRRESTSGARL